MALHKFLIFIGFLFFLSIFVNRLDNNLELPIKIKSQLSIFMLELKALDGSVWKGQDEKMR